MKNRFSKVIVVLLILAMALSLAACGATNTTSSSSAASGSSAASSGSAASGSSAASSGSAASSSSAAEKLASEQVFRYYTSSEPSTLDPWTNNSGSASIIIQAIHEPLLRASSDKNGWEPGLMTDYKANDAMTEFTLTLRSGAKWQDGTEITADDIVYSFQRALDSKLGSEIAYRYYPIVNAEDVYTGKKQPSELGVKAKDAHTIVITTTEPCDYFLDMMTASGFAPIQKAAAEKYGELYGTDVDKTVASGPFKLTEWTHKNSMVLEKNENYWDAANVKLTRLEITITTDANTIQGMYENNELSLMKVTNDQISKYEKEAGYQTDTRLKVTFIEFNPQNAVLSNKNIREAFSIAFNRKIFAQQVMGDEKLAAYGLVPYGVLGKDGGDFREQAGNIVSDASDSASIAHAKELLQKGLTELGKTVDDLQKGFSIQCLESGKVQAQAIQNMWKQNLGVEMPVSVLDFNVILPMLQNGTFDCVIGGGQDSDYRDPQGFMEFIYDENKWDNQEFRSLVEKAHTQTGNDRIQSWMDIEKMVLDNFIYIPQVYAENHWVVKDNVKGLRIFTYGTEFDFKNVYITA